ncbi:hypothetical protein ACFEMC_22065 [Kineococcus sp. DHX-1]|uniref:hypothetical protein n=1 Tax=Kineococcus sp. DHX-1 TaxID=3349638 RepID=UPI0036D26A80
MSISVSGTGLASVAQPGNAGSPAEKALREANRAYAEAQDRLVGDVTDHADEDTLKVDRAELEAAAQAVAQAMAALAAEQAEAQRQRDETRTARQQGPASRVSTTDGGVDLYA